MIKIWNELTKVLALIASLPNSLLFNLHYLPFGQAVRLPIWISYRIKLKHLGGSVAIDTPRFGQVRIGFGSSGMTTGHGDGLWDVRGTIHFKGKARIGCHPFIQVNGELTVGEGFDAGHQLKILCEKHIAIGRDVLLSWNVEIMDHDGHGIMARDDETVINPPEEVVIGNHCWIGCHACLLKGSEIADDCIIGAHTLISRRFDEPGCLIAGTPASIRKKGLTWQV